MWLSATGSRCDEDKDARGEDEEVEKGILNYCDSVDGHEDDRGDVDYGPLDKGMM